MERKKLLNDYFSFSRKDRIGILVLLSLIIIVFFLPHLLSAFSGKPPALSDTTWIAAVRQLEKEEQGGKKAVYPPTNQPPEKISTYQFDRDEPTPAGPKTRLFPFDPNTLSAAGWKELGLRDKTIHTISNYLTKGGHFKKPEDLQRIYGLHPDEYARLAPYIRIVIKEDLTASTAAPETTWKKGTSFHYTPVDINSADTAAFIALPGIGNKLASRIISFREKLGGFYSIGQVAEIYGLADSVFQKIKSYLLLNNPAVRKININTATLDELKNHPYIRYTLANPIIAYRNEHGAFLHLEDIKKIMTVTEELYNKILPYLTIN